MKNKYVLVVVILVTVLIGLPGCGMSDPETEKKLEGTWTYSTKEVEDGIEMTMTAVEKYSLSDHRFETTLTLAVGYPVNETMATIKYRGEWYATKESIVNEVDKGSVTFKFNKDLLDSSERRELKDEMLDEMKKSDYVEGVRIVSPIGDTFEAVDDDGERFTYVRLNSKAESVSAGKTATKKKRKASYGNVTDDYDRGNEAEKVVRNGKIPYWVPAEVLEAFDKTDLSESENEYYRETFFRFCLVGAGDYAKYNGFINDYPITAQIRIDSDGKVEGKYAYESTLKKYGDVKGSWFPMRGQILLDSDYVAYVLIETSNPSTNETFEYMLLDLTSGNGTLYGRMFNKRFLEGGSTNFYSVTLTPEVQD